MRVFFLAVVALTCGPGVARAHGMVLGPVSRASRWREDASAPRDYDDNGLFCGGKSVQWLENGGKCGVCGDNYGDPIPRAHELGGAFGQGVIVKSYEQGGEMTVRILVTANHLGHFAFRLCNLDRHFIESDECFEDILLRQTNGESKFIIDERVGYFDVVLKLPDSLECQHCVLQWTWTTGNSWGICEDGTGALGCGEQETFRTCSDISIHPKTRLIRRPGNIQMKY